MKQGQKSSRQLLFECDDRHELTRLSADKKRAEEANRARYKSMQGIGGGITGDKKVLQQVTCDTLEGFEEMVVGY